ncbi:hypothetical protein FRB99_002662 [Tulasnella sp. 403]|nr:hypothetical protein FRB99_002662 [Tulasnella sp. 403]
MASLASMLAASLPAQQANSAQNSTPQPPKETIPKNMAHAVDVEAEIEIEQVKLEALVVSKIIKHGRETPYSNASGVLLGIDVLGALEVTNSFPLPPKGGAGADDDEGGRSHLRYQAQMLRQLAFVSGDTTIVGAYHTVTMGQFYKQTVVDSLVGQLEKIRHGGIVVIHDVTQTSRGNASFKAFKLSRAYLSARKSGKFNAQSLVDNQLTYSEVFVELPVVIRNSPLTTAFLKSFRAPTSPSAYSTSSSFNDLSLPPPSAHTRALESLLDSLDSYKSEENNITYLSRQIAREKAKAEAHIAKRKEENAARVAQGLAPLPEEDVSRLFKAPPEPSRIESVLLLGQVDAVGRELEGLTSTEMLKMYAARAGST